MVDLHADELLNVKTLGVKITLGVLGVGIVALGLLSGYGCYARHDAKAHAAQADQAHTEPITHAAQGAVYDQQAQAQTPELQAAECEVARLRAEVERLRHPAPSHDPKPQAPEHDPAALPVVPPVDLSPLVAKLDELVKAQDHEITGLKAQVATLTSARDSWKLAAQDSGREALQLRASLAAREGLEKAALWKGRIQGFAVGIGSGYLTGRLR